MDDRITAMLKNHRSTAKYISHWNNGYISDDFISSIALRGNEQTKVIELEYVLYHSRDETEIGNRRFVVAIVVIVFLGKRTALCC